MSDGRASHAGLLRLSMNEIVKALRNDAKVIELGVNVAYSLEHPSKSIVGNVPKYRLRIEPAGFSQTSGAGVLDLQYFTWLTIKYKPATHSRDEEDNLSYLCEYLTDMLHKKMWGGMSTYVSKALINYKSFEITTNQRKVVLDLANDEIGAVIFIWQSPKTIQQVGDSETPDTES